MAKRSQPERRFVLETSQVIFDRGVLRQIVVEARDGYALLRLRGRKAVFAVSWNAIYHLATEKAAERALAARKAELGL